MADWLTSLITETPQEGFELAITLARKGVGYAQPSAEVRAGLREAYAHNPDSLTMASQVIAIHFRQLQLQIITGNKISYIRNQHLIKY